MRTVSPAPMSSCMDCAPANPGVMPSMTSASHATIRMRCMVWVSSDDIDGLPRQQRDAVESIGAQHGRIEVALRKGAAGLGARRLPDALALGRVAQQQDQLFDEI